MTRKNVLSKNDADSNFRSPADARAAEMLKELRLKKGMTQQELALKLGKPQSFVAKYETGARRIDLLDLIALSRALDFDPGRFVAKLAALVD
jgi:transcriptional regulator with XRE-family HTH domain